MRLPSYATVNRDGPELVSVKTRAHDDAPARQDRREEIAHDPTHVEKRHHVDYKMSKRSKLEFFIKGK